MTSTKDLPPPPYDEHVDMRGLDYMPLLVHVLMDSRSWAKCGRRPELAYYLMNIWTAAWLNVPAGSLENDDDVLRDKAKCPADKWADLRRDILHGFDLHSDSRLYHGTVARQVLVALEKREKWRTKKRRQRAGLAGVSPECPQGQAGEMALRLTTDDRRMAAATSPGTTGGQNSANAIVEAFHTLRASFWTSDMPIWGADAKLRLQAQEWIDRGATVEFAASHMRKVMAEKIERGETAPSSLGFCGRSLIDALARSRSTSSKTTRPPRAGGVDAKAFAERTSQLVGSGSKAPI